jgi:acetyltransferase-like isoleucine patch superfamily enzyme
MQHKQNLPNVNSIIYNNVSIGINAKIGQGTIIYPNVVIGDNTFIGPYSIIGEPVGSFYSDALCEIENHDFKKTVIGPNSVIRSHSIIYEDVKIGEKFQSGHRITIREKTSIGINCSIGTLSDIQDHVLIGDYVRVHSNVFMGQLSKIEDFVWIYPSVVLTNDPRPPLGKLQGVLLKKYAQVFASSTILPGIIIGENALVGAHSVVTKNVDDEMLVVGNPAKVQCSIRDIKDKNGNQVYPWKDHLKEYRGYPWQIKE